MAQFIGVGVSPEGGFQATHALPESWIEEPLLVSAATTMPFVAVLQTHVA
jgi:hypothetical protein